MSESLNPLPSSMFFATLFFGSGSNFLASAPGSFPLHEIKKPVETNKTRTPVNLFNKIIKLLIIFFKY